jgi:hypothetical protein
LAWASGFVTPVVTLDDEGKIFDCLIVIDQHDLLQCNQPARSGANKMIDAPRCKSALIAKPILQRTMSTGSKFGQQ